MTLATEKLKASTARHTLVRVRAARWLIPYLTEVSPDIYQMTWPFDNIESISAQGVANYYTLVPALTGANLEYTYDTATGILQLKDLDPILVSGQFSIAYYYIYLCSANSGDLPYYSDPDDTSSALVNWQGRLLTDPSVNTSFTDIVSGVFSIANTNISLINTDGYFEQFIGDNDSFHKKEIKAWLFVNGEKKRVFSGNIASLTINSQSLDLNVYDQFSRLKEAATMGDSLAQSFHSNSATPKDVGKPIPLILARYSWSMFRTIDPIAQGIDSVSADAEFGHLVEGIQAVCSGFTYASTASNRNWTLCRSLGSLKTQTFGSITREVNTAVAKFIKFSSYTNVRNGDTFAWTEAAVTYYGLIAGIGEYTIAGLTYDIFVVSPSADPFTTASTMVPKKTLALYISGGSTESVEPLQGRDFSITETATDSGGNTLKVSFTSNFEANHVLFGDPCLDPSTHQVHFSMENDGTYGHAAMVKRILDQAGIDTLAASFTAAEAELVETTAFSIPNIDESSYQDYTKYLRDLLSSTLGYVWLNNDDEAEYDLLAIPAAGDVKDDNVVLGDDTEVTLEYQDIVYRLTPDNPHIPIFIDKTVTSSVSEKALYLHEISDTQPFRHVMADFTNERLPEIMDLRAERKVTYSFATATDDVDTTLGTDVTLDTPRLLGSGDVKVTGIEKSAELVKITATDLLGL